MKAYYDHRPSVIEPVGNGSYLYRYGIAEETIDLGDGNSSTQWACDEVTIWMPITANKITATVITDRWPLSHEQKLVNEYNETIMGIAEGADAERKVERYRSYLAERAAIKAQIDADCNQLGIR